MFRLYCVLIDLANRNNDLIDAVVYIIQHWIELLFCYAEGDLHVNGLYYSLLLRPP